MGSCNFELADMIEFADTANMMHLVYPWKELSIAELDQKKRETQSYKQMEQIGYRLLSHIVWSLQSDHPKAIEYESCPEYIKHILYSVFINSKNINIHNVNKLQKYFFEDDHGWIDLDLLYMVCPNMKLYMEY